MSDISVSSINYYPIKSCGGVTAETVGFTELGIEYDREWMLVGNRGQFLSQRTHPTLALVRTDINTDNLYAEAPGMGRIAISLRQDPDAAEIAVDLFKKPGTGRDAGTEASEYFSDYLGKPARLVRIAKPRDIRPDCRVDGASVQTGFADGFPVLLASLGSLAEMNTQLAAPVTMDRFRPNVVIEGAPAYDEDYWREIRIGPLRAFVVRACARCPMPNVDQSTGVLPKERPVTAALRMHRSGIDPVGEAKGEFFGQNVVHVYEPGITVSVGDPVVQVTRADERNFNLAA